jgi:hypothetical protein
MKINKILAAGIAATLAVTSLSAVVSAEVQTKTFEVYKTTASFWNHSIKLNADVNKNIAQKLRQATTGKIVLDDLNEYVHKTLNYQGFLDYLEAEEESSLLAYYKTDNGKAAYHWGADLFVAGVSITATGYQHIGDTATVTKTFKFKNQGAQEPWYGDWGNAWSNENKGWELVILDDSQPIYHDGEFASYFFSEITSLQLEVQLSGQTELEDQYNYWNWINANPNKRYIDIGDITVYKNMNDTTAEYMYGGDTTLITGAALNAIDRAEIDSVQATEELTAVGSATAAAPVKTDIGLGVIVGAQVTTTDIGSPLKSNQVVAKVTGEEYIKYTTPIAAAFDATKLTAFDPADAIDCSTTPCVFGSTGKSTGYVYKVTYDGADAWFWSATDYSSMTAANALAAAKLIAFEQSDLLTDNTTTVIEVEEFDSRQFTTVVPANATKADAAGTEVILKGVDGKYSYQPNTWSCGFTAMRLSDTDSTAHLLAYAFADGGWFVSKQVYGDTNPDDFGLIGALSPATAKTNGWIPKTTLNASKTPKTRIDRTDVALLSSTRNYDSFGQGYGTSKTATGNVSQDTDQTYDATFWDGTRPYGFAGLASQVADFFNKQDNGTITFTFAADAGNTAGKWTDGVPSTEVGLKGFSSEYLNDFALFFNYNNTTGTMLSALKLDPTAGTVTFDISDYLADCGGLTKATLENIYYGLDNGIKYDATTNKYGLWVSKVELAYDDAGKAAVDATTDDDTAEDDAAVVVADDDDDDAEVEDDDVAEDDDIFEDDDVIEDDDDDDDDVDADVIEDDDDDDTDVNNDVDYVDAGADDDANPGTGVGLAVIPAIVAAAAVVVSKKRK